MRRAGIAGSGIIRVELDAESGDSFFRKGERLFFRLAGGAISGLKERRSPYRSIKRKPPLPALAPRKNVLLCFPRTANDPRWRSVGLPAAHLFVGSALSAAGFQVTARTVSWPGEDADVHSHDTVGLTLFEDLFESADGFLRSLRSRFNGLIAAGGPFVTLAPMAAAYHLDAVDLFLRGEVESIFPEVLRILSGEDPNALFNYPGLFYSREGLLLMSDFDLAPQQPDLHDFRFQLGFATTEQVGSGLEICLSRGCSRGCAFCCHVQGRELRRLPATRVDALLASFREKSEASGTAAPNAGTVNINDDDILQDPEYAASVFALLRKHRLKLWGVQSSLPSFFDGRGKPAGGILELVSAGDLYVGREPLVWLGSDVFLKARGRRLGKAVPADDSLRTLLFEFERRSIRNFHYWISSDHGSNWQEFIAEILLLVALHNEFPRFGLLAHAPFLIPYRATPVFKAISAPPFRNQMRLRRELIGGDPWFAYPLVERVETAFESLNRLLLNRKPEGSRQGFFDFLKIRDFPGALRTALFFLKQERFQSAADADRTFLSDLCALEEKLEAEILILVHK